MTTRVLLIRHATHDRLDRVMCGRMEGVALSHAGIAQATALAATLGGEAFAAIYASPLLRARQTADALAAATGQDVEQAEALNEIDMGDWTGSSFDRLADDPAWRLWNTARLHATPPGGEPILEVQARIARFLRHLAHTHPDGTVVAVSHADVIKAACCHALSLSADFQHRFDVDPASVTTLVMGEWGVKLERLNAVG